jgi:hypothetical protein
MDIPVLIQPVAGKGFVATAPAFGWSAEGATEDEALQAIRQKVTVGTTGVHVAMVVVPNGVSPTPGTNALMKWAGTWKDDPMIDDYERAIEEYRKTIDNDPKVL